MAPQSSDVLRRWVIKGTCKCSSATFQTLVSLYVAEIYHKLNDSQRTIWPYNETLKYIHSFDSGILLLGVCPKENNEGAEED